MLVETANIVNVGQDYLEVEAIQQTTCGSCAAQKGCGQSVLSKYLVSSQRIRVYLTHRPASDFKVGDLVELGIDEFAMLKAAVLVYLTPLLSMLIFAVAGSFISEAVSILAAVMGLLVSAIYVRFQSAKRLDNPGFTPIIIDDRSVLKVFSSELV